MLISDPKMSDHESWPINTPVSLHSPQCSLVWCGLCEAVKGPTNLNKKDFVLLLESVVLLKGQVIKHLYTVILGWSCRNSEWMVLCVLHLWLLYPLRAHQICLSFFSHCDDEPEEVQNHIFSLLWYLWILDTRLLPMSWASLWILRSFTPFEVQLVLMKIQCKLCNWQSKHSKVNFI